MNEEEFEKIFSCFIERSGIQKDMAENLLQKIMKILKEEKIVDDG